MIREFEACHIGPAGELLAARHRAHRRHEPQLSPRFEDPVVVQAEVATLFARPGAGGAVVYSGDRVTGYLLGVPRPGSHWGPNVWIEAAGHAVQEAELARDLYAHAAAQWVAGGNTAHYALVPATDLELVDAWFRLGFGQQHVHALREPPIASPGAPGAGTVIRRATRADAHALAELELLLAEHQGRAPVFSEGPPLTLAEARADWEESVGDPECATFVAEREGRVVGSASGCPVTRSSAHSGLARPDRAAMLALVAVRPEARGNGIGRALGERVLAWSREAGYGTVVIDWRATNLLASRAWPRLGFRPTFLRLFRNI